MCLYRKQPHSPKEKLNPYLLSHTNWSVLFLLSIFINFHHLSRHFCIQKTKSIKSVQPILISFWMTPLRLRCLPSPLRAFFSCGSNSCRCLQMFGGSVGTGKASHLCAVLRESANNNPHVIMTMFHFVNDYMILFISMNLQTYGSKGME
jgi:hypothetical protein